MNEPAVVSSSARLRPSRAAAYADRPNSQSPTCPQELLKNDEKTTRAKLLAQ